MRLNLFFLIDALGWEVASRERFLEGFAEVRVPVAPVLGYSCACIPSLLTGKRPREHGRWAMYRRDPERSPFCRYRWWLRAARWSGRDGFIRRRMKREMDGSGRYNGYWQLYSLPLRHLVQFDPVETEDLFAPGGVPGHPTILDRLSERAAPWRVWSWRTPERENFRELASVLEEGAHAGLFLYAPDLDALMHAEGTRSRAVSERVAWYDATIRNLTARARGLYDDVRVVVMSDHGMADTVAAHDLWAPLRGLGLAEPRELLYFLDSTMARFWFGSERARRAVEELLAEQSYGRVLSAEDERGFGVDFASREYGELTFLLEAGHLLVPSYMGSHAPAGMHGFDPGAASSTAFFATTVRCPRTPGSILDVAPLVESEVLR
jgi:hypothetical protein